MATTPASSSPAAQQQQPEKRVKNLSQWMNALDLNESSATNVDEVVGALLRKLELNVDDDVLSKRMASLFVSSLKESSVDAIDEGDSEEASRSASSTKENEPAAAYTTPRPNDSVSASTPIDATTPVNSSPKPSKSVEQANERGRSPSRSTPNLPRGGSRSRTPSMMFRSHRSQSPSPLRRRGSSPFRGFFSRSGSKTNGSTSDDGGAADTPTDRLSGLPPTPPTRPVEAATTPASNSTASFPSPLSPSGNTFLSPDATTTGMPIGSMSPTKRAEHSNGRPTGVGKMRRKTATPVGMTADAADANSATAPQSIPIFQQPVFQVDLSRGKKKTNRGKHRGRKYRAAQPVAPAPPAAVEQSTGPATGPAPGMFPATAPTPKVSFGPTQPPELPKQNVQPSANVLSPNATGAQPSTSPNFTSPMDWAVNGSPVPPTASAPFSGFSIGSGGKKSPKFRTRKNPRIVGSPKLNSWRTPRTQQSSNATSGIFSPNHPTKEANPASRIHTSVSQDSFDSSGVHTLRTASTCSSEVDYSGAKAMVESLREEARSFYTKRDYRNAILKYTSALQAHSQHSPMDQNTVDDLRAVLLANRSAALVMVDAPAAASVDCKEGLRFVSDTVIAGLGQQSEGGPVLKTKLLLRMGKSFLKLGNLPEAEQAFLDAINVAQTIMVSSNHGNDQFLSHVITEAEAGKIEVHRCQESIEIARRNTPASFQSPTASSRRQSLQTLISLNNALRFAPDSPLLIQQKVGLLAVLKRWRELAGYCERLATKVVKSDGLFTGDLADRNPFPGVPLATYLRADFFDEAGAEESSTKKLGSKAPAEAAMRLPNGILPYYIRALRLEERYTVATEAIIGLEGLFKRSSAENETLLCWISRERKKLNDTISGKERGDSLFRNGDYQLAAAQYTKCLLIDAYGMDPSGDGTNAGGRVHAVLHCNRAACLMALGKFQEAITDCAAALRIHCLYMKAMLRRARCHARLERYEEATVEYKRWLQLVEEARQSPDATYTAVTPCMFDIPKDVSKEDYGKVKQELAEVAKSKRTAENIAREEAAYSEERQQWYNQQFGQKNPGDAQGRRNQWYSQEGASSARRWDPFDGKSPNKGSFRKDKSAPSNGSQRQESYSYRHQSSHRSSSWRGQTNGGSRQQQKQGQQPKMSPGSDTARDHYTVLGIERNATSVNIKKAYRKMALRFHPDKNKETDAPDVFRRIKLAYETLNDAQSRRTYDTQLRSSRRL